MCSPRGGQSSSNLAFRRICILNKQIPCGQRQPLAFVLRTHLLGRFRVRPVTQSLSPSGFISWTGQYSSLSRRRIYFFLYMLKSRNSKNCLGSSFYGYRRALSSLMSDSRLPRQPFRGPPLSPRTRSTPAQYHC